MNLLAPTLALVFLATANPAAPLGIRAGIT